MAGGNGRQYLMELGPVEGAAVRHARHRWQVAAVLQYPPGWSARAALDAGSISQHAPDDLGRAVAAAIVLPASGWRRSLYQRARPRRGSSLTHASTAARTSGVTSSGTGNSCDTVTTVFSSKTRWASTRWRVRSTPISCSQTTVAVTTGRSSMITSSCGGRTRVNDRGGCYDGRAPEPPCGPRRHM
jgi:hypothetical protein